MANEKVQADHLQSDQTSSTEIPEHFTIVAIPGTGAKEVEFEKYWTSEGSVTLSEDGYEGGNLPEGEQIVSILDGLKFLRKRPDGKSAAVEINVEKFNWASIKKGFNKKLDVEEVGGSNSDTARENAANLLSKTLKRFEKEGRNYLLVGYSHGGTVGYRAIKKLVGTKKHLNRFQGLLAIAMPQIETRSNIFQRTISKIPLLSPTFADMRNWLFLASLIFFVRLLSLVLLCNQQETCPLVSASSPSSTLSALLNTAPISGWCFAIFLILSFGITIIGHVINWFNDRAERRFNAYLKDNLKIYHLHHPKDEILGLFENLNAQEVTNAGLLLKERFVSLQKKYGLLFALIFLVGKLINEISSVFWKLSIVPIILSAYILFGGKPQAIFGFEGTSLESFLGDPFVIYLATSMAIGLFVYYSSQYVQNWLRVFQTPIFVEKVIAHGVFGLRRNFVPRKEEMKDRPPHKEITIRPEAVWECVQLLADSKSQQLVQKLRNLVYDANVAKKVMSLDIVAELRALQMNQSLLHCSYFSSKLFMLYVGQLIGSMSSGLLAKNSSIDLEETAKVAQEADINLARSNALAPLFDKWHTGLETVGFKQLKPQTWSWSDKETPIQRPKLVS